MERANTLAGGVKAATNGVKTATNVVNAVANLGKAGRAVKRTLKSNKPATSNEHLLAVSTVEGS